MTVNTLIWKLMGYAKSKLYLDPRNENFALNGVLHEIGASAIEEDGSRYEGETIEDLLAALVEAGVNEGYFAEEEAERVTDGVMGLLMLSPKEFEEGFALRLRASSKRATDWFYEQCVRGDYVKRAKLDRNPRFRADNGLIITINLAKPEFRDPKKAKEGNAVKGGYPKCSICRQNEGYAGRNKRTLRTVSLKLGGENWFWQYSPYGYFDQHGIAVNVSHTPMHVDRATFVRLMDFVDLFPHYFIGCNAPLPRIGGSVLAHDHYQGGGERLPIFDAKGAIRMRHKGFPEVIVEVLDWPGTAIRLSGKNRDALAALAEYVRAGWCSYRNEALGIIPEDADGVHSAVSPTVVKSGDGYEVILILRNNITSETYPDGVFHAHPEFHVIKKESIGLIEAEGLFILPGRLVGELKRISELLVAGRDLPDGMEEYRMIFNELRGMEQSFTKESAEKAIGKELSSVCERILKNTAVFKSHRETAEFLKGLALYEI